ncbi:MAG: excinuclease ABC subunit UvrC [Tissierellia bacterium]|nr:excinuclease ABC subunit UvrC [Tissierellia bacterium]
MFVISEEIKKLPPKPGVYIMKDEKDTIIYVGKAKNLRNRVRSYFQKNLGSRKVEALVKHIASFEYIIVDNEVESLILESNLIKTHRPKYNILLRDDKQYPYIKLTNEAFPRLVKVRELRQDGAKYFGPFPNATAVNVALDWWEGMYKLRTCKKDLSRPTKPCLSYFIEDCSGPCTGKIAEQEYAKRLQEPLDFMMGKNDLVLQRLEEKMMAHAKNMEYEQAAQVKEAMEMMRVLREEQKISEPLGDSRDYIAYANAGTTYLLEVFYQRDGKMVGKNSYLLEAEGERCEEIFTAFIKQHYVGLSHPPAELVLEVEPVDLEVLQQALKKESGHSIRITIPKRGDKKNTIAMVKVNAGEDLAKHKKRLLRRNKGKEKALYGLAEILGTGEYPSRIESFDISHIQGTDAVGAMVVFREGYPERNDYRRFKIQRANPKDDLACLEEMLERRFKRFLKQDVGFQHRPDLLLMDGGKTQVRRAEYVLQSLGINIPVMGMVKDQTHTTQTLLYEDQEYQLKKLRDIFTFVSEVQNEVHRFAISYHRSLRGKSMVRSQLDGIQGVGPKRKKILLDHYGSLSKIKEAPIDELAGLPGMNRRVAEAVKEEMEKYEL